MIVLSGDEVSITPSPIRLDQREPRLIEVAACVKTDNLCMLGIDEEEIESELGQAGFELVLYQTEEYGHAVGLAAETTR
jgi:hypothetical protein